MESIITGRGLAKSCNSLRAVDSIDFEIRTGECFGFPGQSSVSL